MLSGPGWTHEALNCVHPTFDTHLRRPMNMNDGCSSCVRVQPRLGAAKTHVFVVIPTFICRVIVCSSLHSPDRQTSHRLQCKFQISIRVFEIYTNVWVSLNISQVDWILHFIIIVQVEDGELLIVFFFFYFSSSLNEV